MVTRLVRLLPLLRYKVRYALPRARAEFLDALKTGRYQYKSLTDEERGVRVHGDAGIVSGTCRIVVTASGKDIDIRVRFTELWVKEGGACGCFSGTRPMCPSRLVNTSRSKFRSVR
jgi:Domain of unknown function (DUF4440)